MPSAEKQPRTLYDKVFTDHIVNQQSDGTVLLYIGKFECDLNLGTTNMLQTDI